MIWRTTRDFTRSAAAVWDDVRTIYSLRSDVHWTYRDVGIIDSVGRTSAVNVEIRSRPRSKRGRKHRGHEQVLRVYRLTPLQRRAIVTRSADTIAEGGGQASKPGASHARRRTLRRPPRPGTC